MPPSKKYNMGWVVCENDATLWLVNKDGSMREGGQLLTINNAGLTLYTVPGDLPKSMIDWYGRLKITKASFDLNNPPLQSAVYDADWRAT